MYDQMPHLLLELSGEFDILLLLLKLMEGLHIRHELGVHLCFLHVPGDLGSKGVGEAVAKGRAEEGDEGHRQGVLFQILVLSTTSSMLDDVHCTLLPNFLNPPHPC